MNNILDLNNNEKREQIKDIIKMPVNARILPLYDSSSGLKANPIKNKFYKCSNRRVAGKYAYDTNSWCVLFYNNIMTRYKADSIAPIKQSRQIYSLRSLAQYVIDMMKESDVYFATDNDGFTKEFEKLPILIGPTLSDEINFNFDDFNKLQPTISRFDFVMNDSGDFFKEELNFLKGRSLRFIVFLSDLYIMDSMTGVVFDKIAMGFSDLSYTEKTTILESRPILNGRTFQGEVNGINRYIGNVFLENNVLLAINKLKTTKINENLSNIEKR